jgi:hypothetical protein
VGPHMAHASHERKRQADERFPRCDPGPRTSAGRRVPTHTLPHHGLGTSPLRLLAGPSCASWRQSPARASDLWTAPSRTKQSWPCFFPAATAAPRDRFPAKNAPTPVLRCASAENGSAARRRP